MSEILVLLDEAAWRARHGGPPPAAEAGSAVVVRAWASRLDRLLPPGGPELLSLGGGHESLDLELLQALKAARRRPRYLLACPWRERVEPALAAASALGIAARGVLADLAVAAHVEELRAAPGAPRRLALALGPPPFVDPRYALSELRRLLRRGDRALVEGRIGAGEGSVTRAGFLELLAGVASLEVIEEGASADGRFLLVLGRPMA